MNEYVQSKVNPPGIALAVLGGVSILANLLIGVLQLVGAIGQITALVSGGAGADLWIQFGLSQGWSIVMALISFFVSFVVLLAGLRLRSARSAGLVYTGSIFAMLPCCIGYCCCWFGILIGGWAIFTMQDEQVKAAFDEG